MFPVFNNEKKKKVCGWEWLGRICLQLQRVIGVLYGSKTFVYVGTEGGEDGEQTVHAVAVVFMVSLGDQRRCDIQDKGC